MNKKDQENDIYQNSWIQNIYTNTGLITSYYNRSLIIYGITTDENRLSKTSKAKCKKVLKRKISDQANQCYKKESSKLSKTSRNKKRKKIIKGEKVIMQFKRSEHSLSMKARSITLNLTILTGKTVFYAVQYKNGCLVISDLFHLFTQSIKFYTFCYGILKSSDVWKCYSSNSQ